MVSARKPSNAKLTLFAKVNYQTCLPVGIYDQTNCTVSISR